MILPELLALVTRKKRYLPDFEWSKSWVYNVFRFFELIFWRKEGIRREAWTSVENGVVVREFFTLEARLVYYESLLRKLFAYSFVEVKYLKLAGTPFVIPIFNLAIAFDTIGAQAETTGDASSAYIVTGSDPLIFGWAVNTSSGSATLAVTSMTYNGVSLTAVSGTPYNPTGVVTLGLWILPACATGSNTLATGTSGINPYRYGGWSYSGCKPTSQPDAQRNNSFIGTALSEAITTVADNCWALLFIDGHVFNGGFSSPTNLASRQVNGTTTFGDGGPKTPAGSFTQSATMTNSDTWGLFQVSFAPVSGGAAGRRTLLGVGV